MKWFFVCVKEMLEKQKQKHTGESFRRQRARRKKQKDEKRRGEELKRREEKRKGKTPQSCLANANGIFY